MGALTLLRKVVVLGSTGSIGVSTLSLFEASRAPIEILALTAGRNVEKLIEQAIQWRPAVAVIEDESKLEALRAGLAGTACAPPLEPPRSSRPPPWARTG
jgi:1-deoxy-D-xylulose-5-phosphate reductoisomerase